jgi:SHS2 domain-containing protein
MELEIEADSEAAVFGEALAGLRELMGGPAPHAERSRVAVVVEGSDRQATLVAWLEELLWIAEREQVIPDGVEDLSLHDGELRAQVVVAAGAPRPLVKAVTWHDLCFEALPSGYRARVVLDV